MLAAVETGQWWQGGSGSSWLFAARAARPVALRGGIWWLSGGWPWESDIACMQGCYSCRRVRAGAARANPLGESRARSWCHSSAAGLRSGGVCTLRQTHCGCVGGNFEWHRVCAASSGWWTTRSIPQPATPRPNNQPARGSGGSSRTQGRLSLRRRRPALRGRAALADRHVHVQAAGSCKSAGAGRRRSVQVRCPSPPVGTDTKTTKKWRLLDLMTVLFTGCLGVEMNDAGLHMLAASGWAGGPPTGRPSPGGWRRRLSWSGGRAPAAAGW